MSLTRHVEKLAKKLKIDEDVTDNSNKIMPKIIIGNYKSAKNREFFKKHNIKAVLNCTKDLPNSFQSHKAIEYLRIPIDDSLKDVDIKKMYDFLPVITQFIHKHAGIQKNAILVHCVEGSQRSVTAVVAYLMEMHKMHPLDACEFVLKKRNKSFHHGYNVNFEKSITAYHKKLERERACKR